MVKIHVDGAMAKTQSIGAYGAVCRDEHGLFMDASSVTRESIVHPELLEALACAEAIADFLRLIKCSLRNLKGISSKEPVE